MKKLLALLIVFVFGAGLYWVVIGRFNPSSPRASYAQPADREEAQRQDLDYLRFLLRLDRSFSDEEAQAFEAGRLALLKREGRLSQAEFALGVSRLVALSDNGHTNVAPGTRARLLNRIPLRMAWFADALHVIRSDAAHASLLGAEVLAINGRSPSDWLVALKPYRGGRIGFARAGSLPLMESPEALASLYPESKADSLQLAVRLMDGSRAEMEIVARPADPDAVTPRASVYLSPVDAAKVDPDGLAVLDSNVALPLSLRGYGSSLRSEEVDDVLYLHLWSMSDDAVGSVSQQLARLLQSKSQPWRAAIVDLRFNGGGDYTKIHAFAKALPDHVAPDGRIAVLVNNDTFSAALVTAAWLKYYGNERTVMVGEALGDDGRFWAEGGVLRLPNSKLAINFATGYHDWETGCDDVVHCFTPNFWFGVAAGPLDPPAETGWRFGDYMEGRDTALESAFAQLGIAKPRGE